MRAHIAANHPVCELDGEFRGGRVPVHGLETNGSTQWRIKATGPVTQVTPVTRRKLLK